MKKMKLFLSLATAILFISACTLCVNSLSVPVFAVTRPMCVVLDAGHGGIDGGVTGRESGTKESDLNLTITMKLKGVLETAGFDVVLTRKTSSGLYGAATKGFKKRDMQKRKEIIEEAKPVAMISIHQNFYPTRASRGGQVFYKSDNDYSHALADRIQERMNLLYADEGARTRTSSAGDYYMLKCTSYTSVIVECGFLSNAADERLLLSDDFQQKVAEAVYVGFAGYLAQASGA